VRQRPICAIATTILLCGGFAASADAKAKAKDAGGAVAPASTPTGGTTGLTGISGSTAGTGPTSSTGSTNPTAPLADLAPIVLGKGESPTAVYGGPIFEVTATGLVPYDAGSDAATSSTVLAGGTTAAAESTLSTGLPQLEVPGDTAEEVKIDGLGFAAAPENAPIVVQEVIWAANRIIGRPYVYGGGHKSFRSWGYDCSGTVSYALHGGDLLSAPLDSGQFMSWGARGQGQWMTILTNSGHAYLDVAGLRLDTSPANDPTGLQGPRWRPLRPDNGGYVKRHPLGY
jgi:cell wall-associated NlpC family hydrolase